MEELIKVFIDWTTKNLKKPKLYVIILLIVLVCTYVLPYIDANIFYYNRIEKRISNLQNLSEINLDMISDYPILKEEFDDIILEIKNEKQWMISYEQFNSIQNQSNNTNKFLSGAVLFWIIAVLVPFMKGISPWHNKLLAILLMLMVGYGFGIVAINIPILFNPTINYIIMPILEILIFAAIGGKNKEK